MRLKRSFYTWFNCGIDISFLNAVIHKLENTETGFLVLGAPWTVWTLTPDIKVAPALTTPCLATVTFWWLSWRLLGGTRSSPWASLPGSLPLCRFFTTHGGSSSTVSCFSTWPSPVLSLTLATSSIGTSTIYSSLPDFSPIFLASLRPVCSLLATASACWRRGRGSGWRSASPCGGRSQFANPVSSSWSSHCQCYVGTHKSWSNSCQGGLFSRQDWIKLMNDMMQHHPNENCLSSPN